MKKKYLIFIALVSCLIFLTNCKKEDFVVTFHPNGARGAIVSQSFTQKIAQTLMANPFTYRGYVFAGWNTSSEGSGVSYQDQENVFISSNMVLYAQWKTPESNEFKVTFHANGGGVGNMDPQTFERGIPQSLLPNAFIYDGYHFSCWCTTPNGDGQKFENQQNITVLYDMTLYAQWTSISHTYFVYFHPNGGEGSIASQQFTAGVAQPLDSNAFSWNEHTFINWNTAKDGSGIPRGDKEEITIFRNLVLYAQWKEK
jgi:hypothetical protein